MNEFVIMTDSSCDLPSDIVNDLQISVLPLSVNIKGDEYKNYLDERDIKFDEFYKMIREGELAKTSAVNVDAFLNEMEKHICEGKDILCLSFSSGLSNTYNAAKIASKELSAKYPERKIYAVDTLCASLGQGMLVYLAAKEKQAGKTIDEVRDFCENNKLHICHMFTVDDLHHLKRGGRISSVAAIFGTVLHIKPVLHVDNEGHLINISKARGRKESLESLVDYMERNAIDPESQTIFISHGDCYDDAKYIADLVRKRMNVKKVIINYVGPVIGAHSGPGTIALFYFGKQR